MSWSISMLGKPEAICTELDEESKRQSGQCKIEFDAALPHLKDLVRENFAKEGLDAPLIQLDASGSGYATGGVQAQRSCTVSIKPIWTKLLT